MNFSFKYHVSSVFLHRRQNGLSIDSGQQQVTWSHQGHQLVWCYSQIASHRLLMNLNIPLMVANIYHVFAY